MMDANDDNYIEICLSMHLHTLVEQDLFKYRFFIRIKANEIEKVV